MAYISLHSKVRMLGIFRNGAKKLKPECVERCGSSNPMITLDSCLRRVNGDCGFIFDKKDRRDVVCSRSPPGMAPERGFPSSAKAPNSGPGTDLGILHCYGRSEVSLVFTVHGFWP